jgi:hypothetical protein
MLLQCSAPASDACGGFIMQYLIVLSLVAALSCGSLSAQESQPSASEPQASQPATSLPSGVDVAQRREPSAFLIEVKGSGQGKTSILTPSGSVTLPMAATFFKRYVDETGLRNGENLIFDRRTYLESQETSNGRTTDDGAAGVGVEITYKKEGGSNLVVLPPRTMLQSSIDQLLAASDCIGLWLPIPKVMTVDAPIELRSPALAYTLFDLDGVVRDVKGTLRLDGVDEKQAKLSGFMEFEEDVDQDELTVTASWTVRLDFAMDRETRAVQRIDAKATFTVAGREKWKGKIDGEVTVESHASSKLVSDAKGLRATKPTFRDKAIRAQGLEGKISSRFLESSSGSASGDEYFDSTHPEAVYLQVQRVADKSDILSKEYLTAFQDSLKDKTPAGTAKLTTTPLGRAIAYEIGEDGEGNAVRGVMIPVAKGECVIVRLHGAAAGVKSCDAELRKLIASLRRVKE